MGFLDKISPIASGPGMKAMVPLASKTGQSITMPLLSRLWSPSKAGSHAEAKAQDQARVKGYGGND